MKKKKKQVLYQQQFVYLTGAGEGAGEEGFGVESTIWDGGPYTDAGGPAAGGCGEAFPGTCGFEFPDCGALGVP